MLGSNAWFDTLGRSTAFEVEDDDDYRPARKSSTIDRWSSDGPSDVDFSSRPRR